MTDDERGRLRALFAAMPRGVVVCLRAEIIAIISKAKADEDSPVRQWARISSAHDHIIEAIVDGKHEPSDDDRIRAALSLLPAAVRDVVKLTLIEFEGWVTDAEETDPSISSEATYQTRIAASDSLYTILSEFPLSPMRRERSLT